MAGLLIRRDEDSGMQREDHLKAQRYNNHLQANKRGLRTYYPCCHLDLRLLTVRTVRKYLFKRLCYFVMAALAN